MESGAALPRKRSMRSGSPINGREMERSAKSAYREEGSGVCEGMPDPFFSLWKREVSESDTKNILPYGKKRYIMIRKEVNSIRYNLEQVEGWCIKWC